MRMRLYTVYELGIIRDLCVSLYSAILQYLALKHSMVQFDAHAMDC